MPAGHEISRTLSSRVIPRTAGDLAACVEVLGLTDVRRLRSSRGSVSRLQKTAPEPAEEPVIAREESRRIFDLHAEMLLPLICELIFEFVRFSRGLGGTTCR